MPANLPVPPVRSRPCRAGPARSCCRGSRRRCPLPEIVPPGRVAVNRRATPFEVILRLDLHRPVVGAGDGALLEVVRGADALDERQLGGLVERHAGRLRVAASRRLGAGLAGRRCRRGVSARRRRRRARPRRRAAARGRRGRARLALVRGAAGVAAPAAARRRCVRRARRRGGLPRGTPRRPATGPAVVPPPQAASASVTASGTSDANESRRRLQGHPPSVYRYRGASPTGAAGGPAQTRSPTRGSRSRPRARGWRPRACASRCACACGPCGG